MSNIDAFSASLDRLANPLDMTRDELGRRLLDAQAKRMMDRAANEEGDEGRWKENRGKYGEEKRRKGLKVGVGLRPSDSPMLSVENVRGERDITPEKAEMRHGATDEARQVGEYFSAERPWYGRTAEDDAAIQAECAEAVARHLKG